MSSVVEISVEKSSPCMTRPVLINHHRLIGVNSHQEVVTVFSGLPEEIHVTVMEKVGHHIDVDACDSKFP